jgi:hypothetical protein
MSFDLARRRAPEDATALLVLTDDVRAVLALRARLGQAAIHATGDGFLLVRDRAIEGAFPRAIRLRALADGVFLPADADLVPSLLDDEARALGRSRGLVFLKDRVLAFDRTPLALASLLTIPGARRRAWTPLPERPPGAERLRAIVLEVPPGAPEAIIESGAPAPEATPEKPAPGLGDKADLALGKGLFKLGKALGWEGLARAGAERMDKALDAAPGLGAGVLGSQEAALRDLLREFREGDLDAALRRALPMGEPGSGRGATAAGDARLPRHDLSYSLGNVLGKSAPASVWFGGGDVQRALAEEYRKAALEAVKRGDHRRAAFIYGKLLRDWKLAAAVLLRAGFHHDAAILYLEKCDDPLAAARAFAAAGEVDRAVELYRERHEHVAAADLLRSSGDEDRAIAEFQLAADALARDESDHAAGNLMLNRAGRADLAVPYLEAGWAKRPRPQAYVCAVRLADVCSQLEATDRLLGLVAEAEDAFRLPGNDEPAAHFWNALVRIADRRASVAGLRADLRDRARLGIATKLRQRATRDVRPISLVTDLLGHAPGWSPGVVADATFAVAAAAKRRETRERDAAPSIRVAQGKVTAVAGAPRAGEVFLGFASGEIFRFRAADREVTRLTVRHPEVIALATDADGSRVVALRGSGEELELVSFVRRGEGYAVVETRGVAGGDGAHLAPRLLQGELALWDGFAVRRFEGSHLLPVHTGTATTPQPEGSALALLDLEGQPYPFKLEGGYAHCANWNVEPVFIGWMPQTPRGSTLRAIPFDWLQWMDWRVSLVGLGETGSLLWSELDLADGTAEPFLFPGRGDSYLAATIVRRGLVAAVAPKRVEWLEASAGEVSVRAKQEVAIPSAVACFALEDTGELAVVTLDGWVVCLKPGF